LSLRRFFFFSSDGFYAFAGRRFFALLLFLREEIPSFPLSGSRSTRDPRSRQESQPKIDFVFLPFRFFSGRVMKRPSYEDPKVPLSFIPLWNPFAGGSAISSFSPPGFVSFGFEKGFRDFTYDDFLSFRKSPLP